MISGTWQTVVERIDDLLDDPTYAFAEKTLTGLRERITAEEHASLGQRNAVYNILRSVAQRETPIEKRSQSRRYEGFGSGRSRDDD